MDNCPFFNPLVGAEIDVIENAVTTFLMLNPDSPQYFKDLSEQLVRNALKVLKRLDKAEGIDGKYSTFIWMSRLLQNNGGQGRELVQRFAKLAALFVVLLSLYCSPDPASQSGRLGGLLNSNRITDPTPVTQEDLDTQYQAKDPVTIMTQEMLEVSVTQYLSRGDFSGLDTFLATQKDLYRSASGEESAAIWDWDVWFDALRGDLTATINLNADNAPLVMAAYSSPQVLAAAVAYSPMSIKENVFLDWSAAILPAVPADGQHTIDLTPTELESPAALLADISRNTGIACSDLVAYDMVLFGYQFKLYMVANEWGYYQPFTLMNTDGFMPDPLTRAAIESMRPSFDPYTNIDDIFIIPELTQDYIDQLRTEHPELFDEYGQCVPPQDST